MALLTYGTIDISIAIQRLACRSMPSPMIPMRLWTLMVMATVIMRRSVKVPKYRKYKAPVERTPSLILLTGVADLEKFALIDPKTLFAVFGMPFISAHS